jgi:hypothetical protein
MLCFCLNCECVCNLITRLIFCIVIVIFIIINFLKFGVVLCTTHPRQFGVDHNRYQSCVYLEEITIPT